MDEDLTALLEEYEESKGAGTIHFHSLDFKTRLLLIQAVRNLDTVLWDLAHTQAQIRSGT